MTNDSNDRDRLENLLADRALFGLTAAEERELQGLQEKLGDKDEDESLEATAAILALGLEAEMSGSQIPEALRAKIEADASAYFADAAAPQNVVPLETRQARSQSGQWGWVAAAACLALAIWAWWSPLGDTGQQKSPGALRDELLANTNGVLRPIAWTATEDAAAATASGDVVWSNALQEGYMTFRGLPANDPGEYQYQLWIFDAERDDRYPVDGGVFDIAAGVDEVVVPIRAGLPVDKAVLFAITIEKPGGVVVSSRERLVVLADASTVEGS